MMIRPITPADQEQLLLLEEEHHDDEGKEHKATLEEALGSKEAITLLQNRREIWWPTCWRQKTSI